ncbi:MAG: hypothetical protein WD845_14880 [Pirellulales bacterium]
MKTRILCWAVVFGFASAGAQAATFPTSFTFDTVNSAVDITLNLNGSVNLGTGTALGSSGSMTADIEQSGTAPPALGMSNVQGSFDVIDFSTSGGLVSLSFEDVLFTIGLSAGPFLTDGFNPGQIDLEGLDLSIPQGMVIALGNPAYDFGAEPLMFQIGAGVFGTLTETGGPLSYDVRLEIPISFSGSATIDLGTLNYDLQGTLFFDGVKLVPEPGSLLLAAMGTALLIPVGRRLRRRTS